MGCAASTQNSKDDVETVAVEVKPEDSEAQKTIRAPSIAVRTNKAAEALAAKKREDAKLEEQRKATKPLGTIVKTSVAPAVRMTKALEKKMEASAPPKTISKGSKKPPVSPKKADSDSFAPVAPAPKEVPNPLQRDSSLSTSASETTDHPVVTYTDADFAGFQTMKLLGKGAFGSTYEAGLKSCKIVCVKVIEFGDLADSSSEMATLRNEISLMKRFNHPNIVQYYGCTEDSQKKQIYIFMEYVTGGTLNHYMNKFSKVPIETAKDWTRQMIEGVKYLHDQGVVHRDIKGANILMTLGGVVKLADFGCSKSIDDACSKTRGCQTMVGTPYWMAPEVLKCESYGTKSDVWSVGCTVCEMVTGKPPWPESENMWSAVYKIANSKGLPPNIPKDLPKQMMGFLERCFERDPSKRASCAELLKHPWLTS